jgi:formate dehydrogenase subunit beta
VENVQKKLREEAKNLLEEKKVDVIVGYEQGTLPLTATPCFITDPSEAEKLVWNAFCVQNLAKFVHDLISCKRNPKSGSNRKTGRRRWWASWPGDARPAPC